MQACYYKDRHVLPTVHEKGPRDYYATFCIDNGRKNQCFTVRPNFTTHCQALEAAYNVGRAKVDELIETSTWKLLVQQIMQFKVFTNGEKRKVNTVYI